MCVILNGKLNNILKLDLQKAWKANSHGAGIVGQRKGKLVVIKGLMTYADLIEALDVFNLEDPINIHFRLATHGTINKDNTHPFKINNNAYLMHNGIMQGLGVSGQGKGSKSDSAHLAEILKDTPQKHWLPLLKALGDKYALITPRSTVLVGNFAEHKQVKMSNDYWDTSLAPRPKTYINKYGYGASYDFRKGEWSFDDEI